jgi:hypothetical protein
MIGRPSFPRSRRAVAASTLLVLAVLGGCARGVAPIGLEIGSRTSFELDWNRYERMRTSKAFAYSGDPRGVCVTGLAYGMKSTSAAETLALDYCEEQRLARGLLTPCELLAVDDALVSTSAMRPDAGAARAGS